MVREIRLLDDLDGSDDDVRTVRIVVGDDVCEIDLSATNRKKHLGRLLEKGRRAEPRPAIIIDAAVRRWAKANGHNVPVRGAIPAEVIAAYRAALEGGTAGEG